MASDKKCQEGSNDQNLELWVKFPNSSMNIIHIHWGPEAAAGQSKDNYKTMTDGELLAARHVSTAHKTE